MSDDNRPGDDTYAELLEFAPLVGLDALAAAELDELEQRLATAPDDIRAEFRRQVRATREAMTTVSAATATLPPAQLRDAILAAARSGDDRQREQPVESPPEPQSDENGAAVTQLPDRRRRIVYLAAAAVVTVAVGAIGWAIGHSMTSSDSPTTNTPEQVFSAPDLKSTSADVAGGTATVYYSPDVGAGVLVMTSVPPPKPGTVYQMWLVGPDGPRSAGTMTDKDVHEVTTALLPGISSAQTLGFSVEPPGGSSTPTSPMVAQIDLR